MLPPLDLIPVEEQLKAPNIGVRLGDKDIKGSATENDDRRYVQNNEEFFNSVVDLNANCTATAIEIDGYEIPENGSLYVTAAHCVYDQDAQSHILTGSFLGESGDLQKYVSKSDQVWINPNYDHGDERGDFNSDVALIYSKDPLPDGVQPAEFQPKHLPSLKIDWEKTAYDEIGRLTPESQQYVRDQYAKSTEPLGTDHISVAGYAADKRFAALTIDEHVPVISAGSQIVTSHADSAPGASGGPVYASVSEDEPIKTNEDGQPVVVAINAGGFSGGTEAGVSLSTALDTGMLDQVPFLLPEGPFDGFSGDDPSLINDASGAGVNVAPEIIPKGVEEIFTPQQPKVEMPDLAR